MTWGLYLLGSLALVSCSAKANEADDLCKKLQLFEKTAFSSPANPSDWRWIEFHWGFDPDPNTIWSWGCRHSEDQIATTTCAWLRDNTNQEFRVMLPVSIMECYGYGFPPHVAYGWGLHGRIKLHGSDDRELILEVFPDGLPESESAIRLSLLAPGNDLLPDELPPITSWRSESQTNPEKSKP